MSLTRLGESLAALVGRVVRALLPHSGKQCLRALVLDEIPGLVTTLLPDGRVEFVNRRTREFYGQPACRFRTWPHLVHPDDAHRVAHRWRQSLEEGAPLEIEFRALHANGTWRWLHSRVDPVRGTSHEIVRWWSMLIDIDDRVRAEQALQARESDLRQILDGIPGFIQTMTPAGESEFINQRILDYFGRSLEELRDWSRVTHPDDIERIGNILETAFRTGIPFELESRGLRADGIYRWFHGRGTPQRDANGNIVRWFHVLTDIDDRKRAEVALRASEHHFRMIVDSIPGFICASLPDGQVEVVNKTLLDYTGKPLEELKNWPVVVHPVDLPNVALLWQRSIETGEPFNVEVRVRRADGTYRWFQCRSLPLRGAYGRILRWYSLLTDIEDRKLAEQVLLTRERDLATIIETIPALVWGASADGALAYANSRVMELTGATFDDLAANWIRYVHPDDRQAVLEGWEWAVRTRAPYESQFRLRRANGTYRWIQSLAQFASTANGQGGQWYGLFIDVHERMVVEEALRDTRARLARATQVATVGELSASIAHEINQPLAAVVAHGHACQSWLDAEPPNLERARMSVGRIIRDGRAAADVIQRIRALFRQAPPAKDVLNMNEVIEEACHLISAELRRKAIVLRTELQEPLPPTLADRVQIQQLISNLARNAIEALEPVADGVRELRIQSLHEGQRVVVHVSDTGVGMKNLECMFEPFFTTKPNGMGMGLAICRSIVEAHGGRLWASQAQPAGTIFSFALPQTPP